MKRVSKLGMPYMGSKRKLAKPIIDFILKENPNTKYFYDLFGGGGAMSFEAAQRQQIKQVHYNEFNKGVVELLKKIKKDGVTEEFFQWVSRDTFKKHKDDETWFGGLCAVVWSFGNNKDKGYIFGKEIEEDKRLLHEICVNECEESLKTFNEKYKTHIKMNDEKSLFSSEDKTQRRLRIIREIKKEVGRLELQQLERLQQLQISNLSYESVEINTPIKETIIYLDPPYEDTAKYSKGISHEELYRFINNSKYKIYMSSYKSDLACVLEIKHRTTLSGTANNEVIEKVFTNDKKCLV